jgi:SAM-dependent methyltransferase
MKPVPLISVEQQFLDTQQAFDSVASQYDGPLGNNQLVQNMRVVLQDALRKFIPPGKRLLDLGCGTGLDAVYFAQHGYVVTAIDSSPAMLSRTCQRAAQAGVSLQVNALLLGIQDLDQLPGEPYAGIYSNLGALNCLPDLGAMARSCARLLEPGGLLICSVIGRYCPWELVFYTLRGDFKRARVRFTADQVPVGLNGRIVWTRYYAPGEFYRVFAPFFERRACRALSLFLPPPYLAHLFDRHPWLYPPLSWLDAHTAGLPLLDRAGDHFMIVMVRRG